MDPNTILWWVMLDELANTPQGTRTPREPGEALAIILGLTLAIVIIAVYEGYKEHRRK